MIIYQGYRIQYEAGEGWVVTRRDRRAEALCVAKTAIEALQWIDAQKPPKEQEAS